MKKIDDNDLVQDKMNDGGTGGNSGNSVVSEKRDSGLWWLVGFILALIILGTILAII